MCLRLLSTLLFLQGASGGQIAESLIRVTWGVGDLLEETSAQCQPGQGLGILSQSSGTSVSLLSP